MHVLTVTSVDAELLSVCALSLCTDRNKLNDLFWMCVLLVVLLSCVR